MEEQNETPTMEEKDMIGAVSPEQVEAWKKEHKHVQRLMVDGHICYLRKPDRKLISYASSVGTKDPLKFNELLLKGCWLGGSMEIQTDDELFLSVCPEIGKLLETKKAELVKC